jgi:uncharacterized membrane protein affecting hemolysin expression
MQLVAGYINRISFEIEILRLQPGDLVVFKTDMLLTANQAEKLRQALKKQLPEGVDSMIVSSASIEVIKAEDR